MKKLLFVLFILLTASNVYAGIFFNAEYGNAIERSNIYFAKIGIGYRFSFFNITSETSYNYFNWSYRDGIRGNPFEDIFIAQQKFSYNIFFIKIRHFCCHPVSSDHTDWYDREGYRHSYDSIGGNDYWSGSISTVSIGLEYEFNL